jgi:probable HAF family extracellular repeat protein
MIGEVNMIPSNRSQNAIVRPLLGAALLLFAAGAARAQSFTNIIDPLNPTFTQALGINDSGTIVGYGNATTFNGFTLTPPPVAANFARLNFPGADGGTQVVGISSVSPVTTVGFYIMGGVTHGFANIGGQGGTFTTNDAPGFAFTQLLGINGSGATAVGYWTHDATGATGQIAGTVSGGPTFTSINALLPTNVNSQATGVNDGGWVVGFFQPTSTTFTGFLDKSGVISTITFPGSVSTQALGVNDRGEIVGDYTLANGDMFGFLDNGGVFTTLDPFGSTAVTANGINDLGQIVGFYTAADGSTIGFETTDS